MMISWGLVLAASMLTAATAVRGQAAERTDRSGVSLVFATDAGYEHAAGNDSTALLVALRDGPAGDRNLREWAYFAKSTHSPPVWILSPAEDDATDRNALMRDLGPYVRAFVVEAGALWATVVSDFLLQHDRASAFGLLGDGVVPAADLAQSIIHVNQALAGLEAPTAVLTRSRSRGDLQWLPDTFISQMWCNRAMLEGMDLDGAEVQDATLLEMLPRFVRGQRSSPGPEPVLVDGTNYVPAVVDLAGGGRQSTLIGNVAAADGGNLYLGTLELALIRAEGGDGGYRRGDVGGGEGQGAVAAGGAKGVRIGESPWPPPYVLEHVATESGLILVNSVNCGYLDFATNFLRAARKIVDVKVLWVAMDETAADFMDALAPGCVAMFPAEGSERRHATVAGSFRSSTFSSQTVIRPQILLHILQQGYKLLWTDSDMVWLGNPLAILPNDDPNAAEVMVQMDGRPNAPCTCLLFMKPTEMATELLLKWMTALADSDENISDQPAFKAPLFEQQRAGMRLGIFPADKFPSGKEFFKHPHEEGNAPIHLGETLVVHNNWMVGHDRKCQRFKQYQLWDVGNSVFPSCTR